DRHFAGRAAVGFQQLHARDGSLVDRAGTCPESGLGGSDRAGDHVAGGERAAAVPDVAVDERGGGRGGLRLLYHGLPVRRLGRFSAVALRHWRCVSGVHGRCYGAVCSAAGAGAAVAGGVPAIPSAPALSCIARMQKAMCSSSSTPSSAAPLTMSSRLTARAN